MAYDMNDDTPAGVWPRLSFYFFFEDFVLRLLIILKLVIDKILSVVINLEGGNYMKHKY